MATKGRTGRFHTVAIIELIIGWIAIVGGAYLLSPLIEVSTLLNGPSPLVAALGSTIGITLFGGLYILCGIAIVYGVYKDKRKWLRGGLAVHILLRLYGILVGFLIAGFLPLTWLSSFTVMLIAIACWLREGSR